MTITIERYDVGPLQTLGRLRCGALTGYTLELPWRENQKQVSCIPAGQYQIALYNSVKFGPCFQVLDVPGRDAILIHAGNYNRDTHGCILPGCGLADLDSDGLTDVTGSRKMMQYLLDAWKQTGAVEGLLIISGP